MPWVPRISGRVVNMGLSPRGFGADNNAPPARAATASSRCARGTEGEDQPMQIEYPYLMFLGDAADQLAAKTAQGIVHWRRDWCVGQLKLDNCNADLGLPDMTVSEAADAGVRTLVIGVANRGGVIGEGWIATITDAIEAGMDVASGLHARIADITAVAAAAKANGVKLLDVRHPTQTFDVGTGARRTGKRLRAVGTDCSVGKMYTALAMEAELAARGTDCDFRATGQTGTVA